MSALLALVPWWGRILAIGALCAAVWGHGYYKGRIADEEKDAAHEAQIDALAKEAVRRNDEKKKLQDEISLEVAFEHNDEVDRIHRYYARRLQRPAGGSAAAAAADRPVEADGAAKKPASCGESAARDTDFELACALDAEQVMKLQDFLRRNNFPIGEPR